MTITELVLYALKVQSAMHTVGMLKYSQFCDSARLESAGHLRLLVYGPDYYSCATSIGPISLNILMPSYPSGGPGLVKIMPPLRTNNMFFIQYDQSQTKEH